MGARQSKRSVDISTKTADAEPKEKLEKIDDDGEKVVNGSAHKGEVVENGGGTEEKEEPKEVVKDVKETKEAEKEVKDESTAEKTEEAKKEGEESTPKTATPDSKKDSSKKKDKKKWSFRALSFSKKDKNKPQMSKDSSKTEDLSKEQLPEATENGDKTEVEEKKEEESPKKEEVSPKTPEKVAEPVAASSPAPAPAPAPVPVKEEIIEKCKVEKVKEEVSVTKEEKTESMGEVSSELVEEVTSIIKEATQVVTESVTTVSSKAITTITTVTEMQVEDVIPPLPISPPPTEAPPPTPAAVEAPADPIVDAVTDEVSGGGGEGMADAPPDTNGLVSDDDEELPPKVNGHSQSPVLEIVESIIEKVEVTKISDDKTDIDHLVETKNNEIVAQE